jgi:hypothetical protein
MEGRSRDRVDVDGGAEHVVQTAARNRQGGHRGSGGTDACRVWHCVDAVCRVLPWMSWAAGADIAGYRKSVVSVNRTAYHGHFELLRLETGFEQ